VIRKLIISNGRSEREVLLVGNVIIGRDPGCHVSEPDPLLSRRHAEVIANVHGVSVRDLNSRNGILVNGEKTREQVLLPGDVVQLGHVQVRYVEEVPRAADGMVSRGMADPRRQAPPSSYDIDRFRPDPLPRTAGPTPGRWTPEPTPLPGRRTSAPMPPPPPAQIHTPSSRGRAAFEEQVGRQGMDQGKDAPRHAGQSAPHDTTIGHLPADMDATILASASQFDLGGGSRWTTADPDATILASSLPQFLQTESADETMAPGNSAFASALAHLSGLATPSNEQVHGGPGAHLVANAELTVTDASPGCAELLGMPGEPLVGDSLTDVFLRGVRRAYAEPDTTLSLSVARGARGSITVTFTLDKTGGTQ
jgi:pSer/pThr/pTyr-binding forkhead associated (FHA) protein